MPEPVYLEWRGRQRARNPEETDPEMTHPHHDASAARRHVERGIEHTHRLGESRPDRYTAEWYAETTYVGDLTALAALTLAQRARG